MLRSLPAMQPEAETPTLSQVLAALTRGADVERYDLEEVLRTIIVTSARTLRVQRVNVWSMTPARDALHCLAAWDSARSSHAREPSLVAARYPAYFAALEKLRSITVFDTKDDPRTAELRQDYLADRGIAAILDVPVLRSGRVVGVVCHEHVGQAREFTAQERLFAGSIGDLVALVLEADERVRAERERANLAERLARLQRLDSLGILAGSIAHDFRNLLQVILVNGDVLQHELTPGSVAAQAAKDVAQAALRASELCQRLLLIERRSQVKNSVADLTEVTEEVVALLRSRVPAGAEIEVTAPPNAFVVGDAIELRQLLVNLIVNALDALESKPGRVSVTVQPDSAPSLEGVALDFRAKPSPPLFLVDVKDTGCGITPAALDRIFEPLFSTKPNGHGLGLASVLGIVRAHSGAVQVESERGRGTVFRVWLPASPT